MKIELVRFCDFEFLRLQAIVQSFAPVLDRISEAVVDVLNKMTSIGVATSRATSQSVISSETELEMHRVIYNWDIANFDRICQPETQDIEQIDTKEFRVGKEVKRDALWDLTLSGKDGDLQIWLHLNRICNNRVKEINIFFSVLILKADRTVLIRRNSTKPQKYTASENGWGMGKVVPFETLYDDPDLYLEDNKLRIQIQLDILGDFVFRSKTPGIGTMLRRKPKKKLERSPDASTSNDSDQSDSDVEEVETDIPQPDRTGLEDPGFLILKRDMKKLFFTHPGADFTIQCEETAFPVHKNILSARSEVFAAMLNHDTLETRSNSVNISDIPASTMEKLLEYIYTGSVQLPNDLEGTLNLTGASDKYQINELKDRCFRVLCSQIKPDNVGKIAVLAYLHNAELFVQQEIRHYFQSHWDSLLKLQSFKECLVASPRAFFDEIKSLKSDAD